MSNAGADAIFITAANVNRKRQDNSAQYQQGLSSNDGSVRSECRRVSLCPSNDENKLIAKSNQRTSTNTAKPTFVKSAARLLLESRQQKRPREERFSPIKADQEETTAHREMPSPSRRTMLTEWETTKRRKKNTGDPAEASRYDGDPVAVGGGAEATVRNSMEERPAQNGYPKSQQIGRAHV